MISSLCALGLGLGLVAASKPPYTGDHLNIHMITHTHDDTGWKLTVDQYFIEEVQWIFDTMIPVLKDNKERKFTYVEMGFFERWWNEQDDDKKQDVLDLIDDGQLQINLGGWCMNDEANPSTSAIIRQMTDGHQFVLREFGDNGRPTTGWHVDPFGHSWVTGGLWAEAGFDTFGISRINYMDLAKRQANKDVEFIWKGSTSLGEDGYIFIHLLPNSYGTPSEISFNGNVFIQTDPTLPTYKTNYVELAEAFITDARGMSEWYQHNHVLVPFGSDFAHQNAYQTMIQMDKLMAYINGNETYNVSMFYSTLADYTQAVNDLDLTWNLEMDDLFVYVSSANVWWTGYFTSRPQLKAYTRSRERDVRVAEQFYVFGTGLSLDFNETAAMNNITKLRRAIDVSQHHDGITGTETTDVTDDYMYMLGNGTERCKAFTEQVAGQFLKKGNNVPNLVRNGEYLMEYITANNRVALVLYNSLAWQFTQVIKLPSNRSDLVVKDVNNNLLESQLNPVADYAQPFDYPCKYIFYILVNDIPPLSMMTLFIEQNAALANVGKVVSRETFDGKIRKSDTPSKMGSGYYTVHFDETTGLMNGIDNNVLGASLSLTNEWRQYAPSGGIYNDGNQNSGAYIFRPAQDNRFWFAKSSGSRNIRSNIFNRDVFEGDSGTSNPGFIVQSYGAGTNQTDQIYVGTICTIDTTHGNFTFNYWNYASNSWDGQTPNFDWIEFNSLNSSNRRNNEYLAGKSFGSVSVDQSSNNFASVDIDLTNYNFNSAPYVLVSPRSTACSVGSSYVATITQITNTQATVFIRRVDSDSAWQESLMLDWMAWEENSQSSQESLDELMTQGSETFTIQSTATSVTAMNFTFDKTDFIVHTPVVLVSIEQTSPVVSSNSDVYYFAVTTANINQKGFGVNIQLVNPDASQANTISLTLRYWAFERIVIEHNVSDSVTNAYISGSLLDEMQQTFKDYYSQSIVAFNSNKSDDLRYIDMQIHLGPLDQGAEFVTRFDTQLSTNNTWYTAQNALEYVKRQYDATIDERIAGNYFPSASQAYMMDDSSGYGFSTIVDVAHGVGSHKDGMFELMLHRRCLEDDHKGVGEVLNETTHIEPKLWLLFDEADEMTKLNRRLFNLQQFHPITFWELTPSTIAQWTSTYKPTFNGMGGSYNETGLPVNVHLQELRYAYSGSSYDSGLIMQFEHLFEINENSQYSSNVTINMNDVINNDILDIDKATEMTLTANLALSDLKRLSWNIHDNDGKSNKVRKVNTGKGINKRLKSFDYKSNQLTLAPRDIRTFVINEDVSKQQRQGNRRISKQQRKRNRDAKRSMKQF